MVIKRVSLIEQDDTPFRVFNFETGLDNLCEGIEEYLESSMMDETNSDSVLQQVIKNNDAAGKYMSIIFEEAEKKTIEDKIKDSDENMNDDDNKKNYIVLRQTIKVIQKDLTSKRIILVLKSIRKSKLKKETSDAGKIDESLEAVYAISNELETAINKIAIKLDSLVKVTNTYASIENKIKALNTKYKGIVLKNTSITNLLSKKDDIDYTEFIRGVNSVSNNLKSLNITSTEVGRSSEDWQ